MMLPPPSLALALGFAPLLAAAAAPDKDAVDARPSYLYNDPIPVECMSRSSETGEHIENDKHEINWIPFPTCKETGRPLEFFYGAEGEVNCTIASIDDAFYHLLEFYVHSDAPLSCRLPSRPPQKANPEDADTNANTEPAKYKVEHIPLVFALAGALQMSHIHISTHMNVLLHSTPRQQGQLDTGVLDSAIAYSTSPLLNGAGAGPSANRRLIIGDPLPLSLSVRWFPTPALPKTEGRVEWQGLGGHIFASTIFYCLTSFIAGMLVAGMYTMGVLLPRRLKGRGLGGATPLGYGVNGGGGVGNGWGYSKQSQAKRMD